MAGTLRRPPLDLATRPPETPVPHTAGTGREDTSELPRVSVGMPVHNGAAYLEEALRSLLAQEYDDFELVISDNASTDATGTICREYQARDPRIRYHRVDENRGAAWNFNYVARLARGEFFRWACHDDTISPSHLRRCVELLDDSPPEVILAYTHSTLVDEHGATVGTFEDGLDTRGLTPHERFALVARRLRYTHVLYGLARREAFMETRLLGAYEASDNVLVAELALLGEFAEIPEPLFHRRLHARSSREANRSARDRARWFDSTNSAQLHFPRARLLREYGHAVWQAPLSARERLLTALALRHWARREARPVILGMLPDRLGRAAGRR